MYASGKSDTVLRTGYTGMPARSPVYDLTGSFDELIPAVILKILSHLVHADATCDIILCESSVSTVSIFYLRICLAPIYTEARKLSFLRGKERSLSRSPE